MSAPTAEQWKSIMGEGIHVAFRKGTDHPAAHHYWMMIKDIPDSLWDDVLHYLVWSLEYMKLIDVTKED
jgi:hypothetical protein